MSESLCDQALLRDFQYNCAEQPEVLNFAGADHPKVHRGNDWGSSCDTQPVAACPTSAFSVGMSEAPCFATTATTANAAVASVPV